MVIKIVCIHKTTAVIIHHANLKAIIVLITIKTKVKQCLCFAKSADKLHPNDYATHRILYHYRPVHAQNNYCLIFEVHKIRRPKRENQHIFHKFQV